MYIFAYAHKNVSRPEEKNAFTVAKRKKADLLQDKKVNLIFIVRAMELWDGWKSE